MRELNLFWANINKSFTCRKDQKAKKTFFQAFLDQNSFFFLAVFIWFFAVVNVAQENSHEEKKMAIERGRDNLFTKFSRLHIFRSEYEDVHLPAPLTGLATKSCFLAPTQRTSKEFQKLWLYLTIWIFGLGYCGGIKGRRNIWFYNCTSGSNVSYGVLRGLKTISCCVSVANWLGRDSLLQV